MRHLATLILVALTLAACDGDAPTAAASSPTPTKYEPALSAELVPPAARAMVLGVATDAELTAAFGAGETIKDASLGGKGKVLYNDAAALRVSLPAKDDIVRGEAWFVRDGDTPRLQRLELVTTKADTCAWIEKHVGAREGATRRPGSNRKFGANKGGLTYTAGTPDGAAAVGIECHPSERDGVAVATVVYGVESSNGTSMTAQEG